MNTNQIVYPIEVYLNAEGKFVTAEDSWIVGEIVSRGDTGREIRTYVANPQSPFKENSLGEIQL